MCRFIVFVLLGCCPFIAFADDPDEQPNEQAKPAIDVDREDRSRMILHLCEADGTPVRPLIGNVELRNKYDRQGTPDVSADGKLVAYDAWSTKVGTWQDARIIVTNIDGSEARDVIDGVMPSFSPDGKRMVVSRTNKNTKPFGAVGQSIWIVNTDGSNPEMIADQGAWGARWSKDGRSLVFFGGVDAEGKSSVKNHLRIYDFKTEQTKDVFSSDQSPFESLVHHFNWTKQGKRMVAFGGQLKRGGSATAVVDVDQGTRLTLIKGDDAALRTVHGLSVDWHPGGEHLLVTASDGARPVAQVIRINQDAKPIELTGIPNDLGVRDPVFTPDGKHLIASLHSL